MSDVDDHQPRDGPEFGPGGYLPDRAAQRARKIVLREQMGMGWPLAALAAGVALLAIAAVYLLTRTGPPPEPFIAFGELAQVDPRGLEVLSGDGLDVLVVRAGGGVRAFVAPGQPVSYCAENRRLEGADGSVWALSGRLDGGPGPALQRLPVEVHTGQIHVNPREPMPIVPSGPARVEPRCVID